MNDEFDIRALRERIGWTQEQLAEFLGLDRSTVSRIENGQPVSGPVRRLLDSLAAKHAPSPSDTEAAA